MTDIFENLNDRAKACVQAILALPEDARRALWTVEAPGHDYWFGLVTMDDDEEPAWYSEGLDGHPVGAIGYMPSLDQIDVTDRLWCPINPTDILVLAAKAAALADFQVTRIDGVYDVSLWTTRDGIPEDIEGEWGASGENLLLVALDVLGEVFTYLGTKDK